jgi:hypothetical protein
MNSKIGLLFLAVLIVVISGCDQRSVQQGAIAQGLDLVFEEGYPGSTLSEGEEFNVNLKIFNGLSYPVDYTLCVSGDRAEFYGGVPVGGICNNNLKIEGSYETQNGEIIPATSNLFFPSEVETFSYVNLDKGVKSTNIIAELEYYIESESNVDVCVLRSKDYESEGEFTCLSKENFNSFDIVQESAPLIVSKVDKEVKAVGGTPQIKVIVYLDKANKGEIVRELQEDFDLIGIEVSLKGTSAEFVCNNQRDGRTIFREGDAIECSANLNLAENGNVYKDNLIIKLSYPYKLKDTKHISFDDWEERL